MRTLETCTSAAGTLAAIGIGTPIVAALVLPIVFPIVLVALAVMAWRADVRETP
ncbi:MAG TPA: hypothetical protein VF912_00835 [Anaeromyxobacter sp.]